MSDLIEIDDLDEDNASQDTTSDASTTTTDPENANIEENSVTIGNTEKNFNIILDSRTSVGLVLDDSFNMNITRGPAICIENSAAVVSIGDNSNVHGERLFCLRNSFLDLYLVGTELSWDVETPYDVDEESTLNIRILEGSNLLGSLNYYNKEDVGDIAVTIDETSTWTLDRDSYIDRLTLLNGDVDRINLNKHNLYIAGEKWIQHPPEQIDKDTGYDSEGKPTQRILQVVTSQTIPIPSRRYKSHLYFVYDKMELWLYCSKYSDLFCIIEEVPEHPVENMLYITLNDGGVYTYTNYRVVKLGSLPLDDEGNPDPDQLALLKSVGSQYFMNAEARYLDTQTRTIQLPFQNGNYVLSLSLGADLKIDSNTVIRFNPATNQFYIAGKEYQPDDRLNNVGKYVGFLTDTAQTTVDGKIFKSDINISTAEGNGLQIAESGGLFVDTNGLAEEERYEALVIGIRSYMSTIDAYTKELAEAVQKVVGTVSEETINQKIMNTLEEYESTIQSMLDNYSEFSSRLLVLEQKVNTELDTKIEQAKENIKEYVNQANSAWSNFSQDITPREYTPEEKAVRGDLILWYRNFVIEQRQKPRGTMVLVNSEGELPEFGDINTVYYVYNSVDRTYTNYTWNIDTSTFVRGNTSVPYQDLYTEFENISTEIPAFTPGSIPPKGQDTLNAFGLTDDEQYCLDLLMNQLTEICLKPDDNLVFDSYYSLPASGDTSKNYYVINKEKNIYRIYKWNNAVYDDVSYDLLVEGRYELIYDLYPGANDPNPRERDVTTIEELQEVISDTTMEQFGPTTINLLNNLTLTSEDVVTVPDGRNINLNIDNHNITCAEKFADVSGNLNITGTGTISTEGAVLFTENLGSINCSVDLLGGTNIVNLTGGSLFEISGTASATSTDSVITATGNNNAIQITSTGTISCDNGYAINSTGDNNISIDSGRISGIYSESSVYISEAAEIYSESTEAINIRAGVTEIRDTETSKGTPINISIDGKLTSSTSDAIGIYKYDTDSKQIVDVFISASSTITPAEGKEKYKVYEHEDVAAIVGEGYEANYDSVVTVTEETNSTP